MLGRRRRRRASIESTLGIALVFSVTPRAALVLGTTSFLAKANHSQSWYILL